MQAFLIDCPGDKPANGYLRVLPDNRDNYKFGGSLWFSILISEIKNVTQRFTNETQSYSEILSL